jgi:lipoyl(octanoyl) transferase
MNASLFGEASLTEFGLTSSDVTQLNERTLLVKKFNWEYGKAHQFQRHCLSLLDEHSQLRIIICCNHPRVFTNGRGLQRPRKGEVLNLVEFDPRNASRLPYPFHQIERGGGLTFHHPGQFIIYPIVKLNPKTLSLSSMIDDLFSFSISVLKDWGLEGLDHENKLLGLWSGEKKLASMGIAIEKLKTFHGMALNFYRDEEMKNALRMVNPCGLNAETYTSVEELMNLENKTLDNFTDSFIRRLTDAWK